MAPTPKVSVIIPTYNRKDWLREALDSVFRQTFQDFEILVADDGSTDGTAAMIQENYRDRVRLLALPHAGLPATGRNAGLRAARGEYVAFLDSDDLWLPHKLALQIAALDRHPVYGWSYGRAERFGPFIKERSPEIGWWQLRSGWIVQDLLINSFIPCCTVVVRKSCLSNVGEFDANPALRSAEDYEFWIRLAAHYPVIAVRRTLARYRITDVNISKDLSKRFPIEKLALDLAGEKLHLSPRLKERAMAGLHLRLFRYLLNTDPGQALHHLETASDLHPGRPRIAFYRLIRLLFGRGGIERWIAAEKWIKRHLG